MKKNNRAIRCDFAIIVWLVLCVIGYVNAVVVSTVFAPKPIVEYKTVQCENRECEIRREPVVIKIEWHSERTNKLASYAYRISGNDLDFVLTLHAENWSWHLYRTSPMNTNGTKDHWLCQLNDWNHDNRVFMTSHERHDWTEQLKNCLNKYKRSTFNKWDPWFIFKAYYVRQTNLKLFTIIN